MSLADIESELCNLSADELRRLALSSWQAFVQKERGGEAEVFVDEDPQVIAAIDAAVMKADGGQSTGFSADEVRGLLRKWTSK
jgi:hypothetical protein